MKNKRTIKQKQKEYFDKYQHHKKRVKQLKRHQRKGSYHDLTNKIYAQEEYMEWYKDMHDLLGWVLDEEIKAPKVF